MLVFFQFSYIIIKNVDEAFTFIATNYVRSKCLQAGSSCREIPCDTITIKAGVHTLRRKADLLVMKQLIYLDNAATTKTRPEVVEAMLPYFTEYYGNPSSVYEFSAEPKRAIAQARETIAKALGAKSNEIYFTYGGTESDNWALISTAEAYQAKGKHIITTKIEHHAILHTCEYLEQRGFEVTYLDVDEFGVVKLDELEKAIRPDTILISVMFANNEIGTIEPIKEIGEIAKKHGILFHTDAVQAFCHVPINVDECHIDMLSSSAHKLNGPKGTGFLYIDEKVKIKPIIYGGGQQKGMRSGTENVPGCAGLGLAAKMVYTDHDAKIDKLYAIKDRMVKGLQAMDGVTVHGLTGRDSVPQIVAAGFEGVRAEVLLHALEDKGIYVSSGSACSSNHPGVSGTLKGIGVKDSLLDSTLRFSFGAFNTEEEVDYCLEVLNELVPMLRRYRRA